MKISISPKMYEIMKCGAREFPVPSLKLLPFPGRISGYFSTPKDGNNECYYTVLKDPKQLDKVFKYYDKYTD